MADFETKVLATACGLLGVSFRDYELVYLRNKAHLVYPLSDDPEILVHEVTMPVGVRVVGLKRKGSETGDPDILCLIDFVEAGL